MFQVLHEHSVVCNLPGMLMPGGRSQIGMYCLLCDCDMMTVSSLMISGDRGADVIWKTGVMQSVLF